MNRKLLAVIFVTIGVGAFAAAWDKLVYVFRVIWQPDQFSLGSHVAMVGQGLFYLIISSIVTVCGILFLYNVEERKMKIVRASCFALVIIWFVLEIPMFKCDFYNVNHSFWESKSGHYKGRKG